MPPASRRTRYFGDVMPGKSVSYTFRANDAGVFMYHCGTKPVLLHIANGMYGAIVVEPSDLPHADKEYVLVASEWYLGSDGLAKPATFDMDKARARMPDWMTFNGYSGQYVTHPLTADPGELVRFWVVDAGPSIDTDFHIVGTIFDTAYPFGDMSPDSALARRSDGRPSPPAAAASSTSRSTSPASTRSSPTLSPLSTRARSAC